MTTRPPPVARVDQVIHGYDRGHKEISASVRLDEASRSRMLIYSDLLADTGDGAPDAYLTCYPLPSASRHVLARTWPAGAGSRPGSVWTHSLVIDYPSLALINDLVALEPLLMRAGAAERGKILNPIEVQASVGISNPRPLEPSAALALERLYGTCDGEIVIPSIDQAHDDFLALALWRQMWPGLRRAFTFVTGPGAGLPRVQGDLILRFVPAAFKKDPVRPSPGSDGAGLSALLDDLPRTGPTPLREFLSRYASEAYDSRSVAEPLAELWLHQGLDLLKRLRILRSLSDASPLPRLTRDIVARELDDAKNPECLTVLVDELGDQPLDIDPARAVQLANAMDQVALARLLALTAQAGPNGLAGRVFDAVARGGTKERLAEAAAVSNRPALLRLRPELMKLPEFWPADDAERAELLKHNPSAIGLQDGLQIFGTSMGSLTLKAILAGLKQSECHLLFSALTQVDAQISSIIASYIVERDDVLRDTLKEVTSASVLERLADAQVARAVVPLQPSLWCSALNRLEGNAANGSISAVCYLAALLADPHVGLKAARKVYDQLQRLLRQGRLTSIQEQFLDATLPIDKGARNLSDRVIAAAFTRWPPAGQNAGALTLSSHYDQYPDLIKAAFDRFGRSRVGSVILDPALSLDVRRVISAKLKPSSWLFW